MTTYTSPFTGQTLNTSQVGYEALSISANTVLQWPINGNNSNVVANILEITATVANLQVALPPALQVSQGQAFIIKNVGTVGNFSFTLTDNSGNTIITIPVDIKIGGLKLKKKSRLRTGLGWGACNAKASSGI